MSARQEFPKSTAKSVTARALAVLGALSAQEPSMTLSQLARVAGLPVATVFRLAGELARSSNAIPAQPSVRVPRNRSARSM